MGSLVELINESPDFKSHLEIKLNSKSGSFRDDFTIWIGFLFNNLGYVSHGEAIAHQRKSQVLLIEIDSEDTKVLSG
jgi:hypothetical protein